jgi:hypothetical protein
MKLPADKQQKLYEAIHGSIVDLRVALKLEPMVDFQLAQVIRIIWDKQRLVLGLDKANK